MMLFITQVCRNSCIAFVQCFYRTGAELQLLERKTRINVKLIE